MVFQREIAVQTSGHENMHDITSSVGHVVRESGVRQGIVHIFNVGSTGAIGSIEYEPGLEEDLPRMLDKLIPASREYGQRGNEQ